MHRAGGAGFRDLVTQELYQAWETTEAGGDPVPALLEPPPMHRRHAAWAVLTVPGGHLSACVRGRMRSLLTALEEAGVVDLHARPRPFERGSDTTRYAIGLGRNPPDAARVAEATRDWVSGLLGCRGDPGRRRRRSLTPVTPGSPVGKRSGSRCGCRQRGDNPSSPARAGRPHKVVTMSINAIGSGTALSMGVVAAGQRLDPEAQRAQVNAQADLLQAVRTVDLPAKAVSAVTDGQGVDLYL